MSSAQRGTEVARGCMDFLLLEMVKQFGVRESATDDTAANEDVSSADVDNEKLEALGVHVGQRLAEKHTRNYLRFTEELEIMKFICKEFWTSAFNKQIDNLKTNHRGVYVLQDNDFAWLRHQGGKTANETTQRSAVDLFFPCGIIRGALTAFGIVASVSAELQAFPQCLFTITIQNESPS